MDDPDSPARAALEEATLDPASAPAPSSAARLRSLHDVARRLLTQDSPAEILAAIHAAILEALSPDHACVLLAEADGGLRPVACHALDLEGPPSEWRVSRTAIERVRSGGLAVLTVDAPEDPLFGRSGSVRMLGIQSILCVPLGARAERGLIYLDRLARDRPFGREDLEFLTALSGYAALVLERAERHLRAVERLEQEEERVGVLEGELLRHKIVGRSPKLLAAYDALRRFARGGARVLLRGETGTGKELFARAYAAESARRGQPYIPVPIPALAPTLVESELFGHVRGAFTEAAKDRKGRLELADRGILFLDEVGDIELPLQAKLLRFLDSGELYRVGDNTPRRVDALVVSATNRPLDRMVREDRFRGDLLARLGHALEIPPLRERPEDVPLLVEHFLDMHDRGTPRKRFADETIEVLQAYRWEFNIRELQQVVERAVCLVEGEVVWPEDLPAHIRDAGRQATSAPAAGAAPPGTSEAASPAKPAVDRSSRPAPLRAIVEAAEREHILRALEYAQGNRRKAIEILGIAPETFYRRLSELGLHQKRRPARDAGATPDTDPEQG